MPTIKCPRCGTLNFIRQSDEVCDECGARLPSPHAVADEARRDEPPDDYAYDERPRLRDRAYDDDYPDVRKRGDRSEAQTKAANEVSGSLFGLAVLVLICNVIGLFVLNKQQAPAEALAIGMAFILGFSGVFVGLGIWARWMPVPAGVVGLVVFVGYCLLDCAGAAVAGGGDATAFRGVIFKIFIIVGLARCVYRASKAE